MKKRKSFFDKIESHKKETVIRLTAKDREDLIRCEQDHINRISEKQENYFWYLIGLGIGLLGNFIVALFCDWIRDLGGWKFILSAILAILLFLEVLFLLVYKLKEYHDDMMFAESHLKRWAKTKSIWVSAPMKVYDEKE